MTYLASVDTDDPITW